MWRKLPTNWASWTLKGFYACYSGSDIRNAQTITILKSVKSSKLARRRLLSSIWDSKKKMRASWTLGKYPMSSCHLSHKIYSIWRLQSGNTYRATIHWCMPRLSMMWPRECSLTKRASRSSLHLMSWNNALTISFVTCQKASRLNSKRRSSSVSSSSEQSYNRKEAMSGRK